MLPMKERGDGVGASREITFCMLLMGRGWEGKMTKDK